MVESDAVVSPAEDSDESGKLAAVVDFLAHKQRRGDGALDRYYPSLIPTPTRIVVDLVLQQGPTAAVELGVVDPQQDKAGSHRLRVPRALPRKRAQRSRCERIETIRGAVIVILTSEPTVAQL